MRDGYNAQPTLCRLCVVVREQPIMKAGRTWFIW